MATACHSNDQPTFTLPSVNAVQPAARKFPEDVQKRRDQNSVHLPSVYPQTTAKMIGWRAGWNRSSTLLFNSSTTHRKVPIEKQLQRPDVSILHRVP